MKQQVLPAVYMFAYGEVGSGQFVKDLRAHFGGDERVLTSGDPRQRGARVGSIKDFLGKGK